MKTIAIAAALLAAGTLLLAQSPNSAAVIKPGQVWNDTKGKPIESHMGGVLFDQGVYYWYGSNFDGPTIPRKTVPGVNYTWYFNRGITIYQSKDLIHWDYVSTVLADVSFDPASLLQPLSNLQRPRIIKNDVTRKYILMAALETPDFDSFNDVVVAVSDSPTGPFKLQGKLGWKGVPNKSGLWDRTVPGAKSDSPTRIRGWDMTLYKDDDGKAYLLTAHHDVYLYELSADYLAVTQVRKMEGAAGEGLGLFKAEGTYFLLTSDLTGWAPNANHYCTAPSLEGPWTPRGTFAKGQKASTTFDSQTTFVMPVAGKPNAFIFMGDVFHAASIYEVSDMSKTTHVWLPITLDLKTKSMEVVWKDEWDLSVFDGR